MVSRLAHHQAQGALQPATVGRAPRRMALPAGQAAWCNGRAEQQQEQRTPPSAIDWVRITSPCRMMLEIAEQVDEKGHGGFVES